MPALQPHPTDMSKPSPYTPDDDICIQLEHPEHGHLPPELCTGADLEAAREFIAENPGWKLTHWHADPREVYHANEGHHLGNL